MFLAGTRPTGLSVLFQSFTSNPVSNFISTNYTIKPIASGAPCWPPSEPFPSEKFQKPKPMGQYFPTPSCFRMAKRNKHTPTKLNVALSLSSRFPPHQGRSFMSPLQKVQGSLGTSYKVGVETDSLLGLTKIICSFSFSEQQYQGSEGSSLETIMGEAFCRRLGAPRIPLPSHSLPV